MDNRFLPHCRKNWFETMEMGSVIRHSYMTLSVSVLVGSDVPCCDHCQVISFWVRQSP
jgi:hypothetical protein